jgi:hypothetical protein
LSAGGAVRAAPPYMTMIDDLIQFAKEHHSAFAQFTDQQIETFFLKYAETTIVRQDSEGEITGFCVWEVIKGIVNFRIIAGIGDPKENFRVMRRALKKLYPDFIKWKS